MRIMQKAKLISLILFLILTNQVSAQTQCTYCGEDITGEYLILDGKPYHQGCYRDHIQPKCDYCSEPIDGQHNVLGDKHYHSECYLDHVVAKCNICEEPLIGKYFSDLWGNSFHAYHSEQLPECSTCGRLISDPLTEGGFSLGDGRHICSLCNYTSVIDDYQIESSLRYVKRLLASNYIDDFPSEIPISLVDSQTLSSISETYTNEMQGFTDHNTKSRNGKIISSSSHIYILTNLPRTLFRAVLAHELLHVYLFQNDLDLRSDIREGFCNLGSELVYENDRSEFAKFRLANMKASLDPDYGVGYRKMSTLLYKKGWYQLLETLAIIE